MTRCSPICGKRKQGEKREKEVKGIERDKDEEALKKLVPKRLWK